MSADHVVWASVEPQLGSALLTAPYDVRRAVYLHVIPNHIHIVLQQGIFFRQGTVLRQGILHLLPCDEPGSAVDDDDCCGDYWGLRGSPRERMWARRLRSSWGPHWKCEKAARMLGDDYEATRDSSVAIPLVCKQMYTDMLELMVETTVFNVTDLTDLDCLLQRAETLPFRGLNASGFLASMIPCIKFLDITLRLPLPFCNALEDVATNPGSIFPRTTASTTEWAPQLTAWSQLYQIIARLKQLRRLQVWLDHDDKSSWSIVNERAILSYLIPLTGIPDLKVSVNLPKLHPRFERPERHFMADGPAPGFIIHRRFRQLSHGLQNDDGSLRVRFEADFPILRGHPAFEDEPLDELEKSERAMWERGVDVEREFMDDGRSVNTAPIFSVSSGRWI